MLREFERLQIHPVIDSVYEFGDVHNAYRRLEAGAFGKVVIRVKDAMKVLGGSTKPALKPQSPRAQ
jgi:hypothetical protein